MSGVSYVGVPVNQTNAAPALIDLVRNVGGSVGMSCTTTMLAERTQLRHARLAERTQFHHARLAEQIAAEMAMRGQRPLHRSTRWCRHRRW
jgi:hypothetical protein